MLRNAYQDKVSVHSAKTMLITCMEGNILVFTKNVLH